MAALTGGTAPLGSKTGMAAGVNGLASVSYRGEENPWGNMWKFVDGLNIYPYGMHEIYVADHSFEEGSITGPYQNAGITLAKVNGYISAFAYNEPFDWMFFPSETLGDSGFPVGDYFYQNYAAEQICIALLGARWRIGNHAGGFYWRGDNAISARYRGDGGRLVYVP
jgi:hypothetical protein